MLTYEEMAYNLQTKSYKRVLFPRTHREISEIVEGPFYHILGTKKNVSPEERKRLYYKLPINFRGGDVGSYWRERKHDGDEKELFHYHSAAEHVFADVRKEYPAFDALLKAVRPLYADAWEAFRNALLPFEDAFPGIIRSFFPAERDPHLFLRIIAYMEGDKLATNHLDMSGATLAIAESDPGLQIGFDEDHLHDITHVEREAVFFPGLTFCEETSDEYPPIWHGVQNTPRAGASGRAKYLGERSASHHTVSPITGKRVARWAVVAFISGNKIRNTVREECGSPDRRAVQRAQMLDRGWKPQIQLKLAM